MEHIIVTNIGNGYYNLKPEEGYLLYDTRSQQTYSEAETKNKESFIAVAVDAADGGGKE